MYYPESLTVVGPTACDGTSLGMALAEEFHGTILSGDSRQVFVGTDIGTGENLNSYAMERGTIPYHLIDIVPTGQSLNLFKYVRFFDRAYHGVVAQQLKPVFVGGSGLYVERILQTRPMHQVPPDATLRKELEILSLDDLRAILGHCPRIDRVSPSLAHKCIRTIEIARYYAQHPEAYQAYQQALRGAKRQKPPLIIGLHLSRQEIIRRTDQRLRSKLEEGMVTEVERLLDQQVPSKALIAYGLECRFITFYLQGKLSYSGVEEQLVTAIHQFVKRQMTWSRGMSCHGLPIHWTDGHQPATYQRDRVLRLFKSS